MQPLSPCTPAKCAPTGRDQQDSEPAAAQGQFGVLCTAQAMGRPRSAGFGLPSRSEFLCRDVSRGGPGPAVTGGRAAGPSPAGGRRPDPRLRPVLCGTISTLTRSGTPWHDNPETYARTAAHPWHDATLRGPRDTAGAGVTPTISKPSYYYNTIIHPYDKCHKGK